MDKAYSSLVFHYETDAETLIEVFFPGDQQHDG